MSKQTKLDAFLASVNEQEKQDRETSGSGEFEDRKKLEADRDVLYEGYFLESSQSEIEGTYGSNTAVRITDPTGEKKTLWVSGFEEQHFETFLRRLETDGVELPVKFSFLRTQVESKTGNTYNKLQLRLDASGDDVQFELDSF
jgi:hypothetical protein